MNVVCLVQCVTSEQLARENHYLNLFIIPHDNDRMRVQSFPDILGEWFEITECNLTKPSPNFSISVSNLKQSS